MATRMREGRGRFRRLQIVGAGLLVALVFFTVVKKMDPLLFQVRIRTATASYGTEETRVRAEAVILRRETIVTASAPGRVTILAGEGRRVRAGDLVVEVGATGDVGPVPARLEEINLRLGRARADFEARQASLARDERSLLAALDQAERALGRALAAGRPDEVQEATSARNAVQVELRTLGTALRQLTLEFEQTERALLQERETALRLRPTDAALVRAPASGIISFHFDGNESLSPGAELVTAARAVSARDERVHDGLRVDRGDPLFRLIDSTGPVEVVVKAPRGVDLSPGTRVDISFDHIPEREFAGRLTDVIETGREWVGRVVIDFPDETLAYRRHARATLASRRAQGIVVPARSVTHVGSRTGVYVMLGDRPIFRDVVVLGGNAERVVIDAPRGVPIDAPVVTNPTLVQRRLETR